MEQIYKKARAKINLDLEVLEKREDGFHNIKSVFQKISLYDEIYVKKINSKGFILKTNVEELNNQENIVYKAYKNLKEQYAQITGIELTLNKKIPIQAGLAGGSTDCATFILCMNELFHLNLSKGKIELLGESLGADVVPCFYNQAVLAEGKGDRITKINTNIKYYIVIIKPTLSFNTKHMYQKLDEKQGIKQLQNANNVKQALEENNIRKLANNLYNVFENAVETNVIQNLKEELQKNGAIGVLMSGAGSCVFGLFENKHTARYAYQQLKEKYQVYICTSYNKKRRKMF